MNYKKFILAVAVFLFMAGEVSYAGNGIYTNDDNNKDNNTNKNNIDTSGGGLYSNLSASVDASSGDSGGMLYNAAPPGGGRPGDGGGIGQETPLSDGLPILLVCGLVYGAAVGWRRKGDLRSA